MTHGRTDRTNYLASLIQNGRNLKGLRVRVVGDLEPPIGAGLFRVVDTDFREDLF
jgi:hypothetical protein